MSREPDTERAFRDLVDQIGNDAASLAVLFVSPSYDLTRLGPAIAATFTCPVLACTTAGELNGHGYVDHTITGCTIASQDLAVATVFLPSLHRFVRDTAAEWTPPPPALSDARRVALLMLDGVSMEEDAVAAMLQPLLGGVPCVGASAAGGDEFRAAYVYHEGAFHGGAGVIALIDTTLPFSTFMLQHFEATTERLIITEALPEHRLVLEINGRSAAHEYARVVGVPRDALGLGVFASHPLLLRAGGRHYVRSIRSANDDDSLTFHAAIDVGLVLALGRPGPMLTSLRDDLNRLSAEVPNLSLVLGFDCLLRRQELVLAGDLDRAAPLLARYPVVGMSTYGEQFNGVHANHTFTGWALGQ